MSKVKLYVTISCPFCIRAKNFLNQKGVSYETIDLTDQPDELNALKERTQWRTVPQIFIGEKFIGGYTDMVQLDEEGQLDPLLASLKD